MSPRSLVPALLLLPALALAGEPWIQVHYVMGTYLQLTVPRGAAAEQGARACFAEAQRLERVFTRFDETSELQRVNAAAGQSIDVSADLARLLARSRTLSAATGGAFDVTIGPLARLWREQGEAARPAVDGARARVGSEHVTLVDRRLRLDAGTALDFDGIAKGYAVDRCVDLLRAAGVRRGLVSLGESSLFAIGAPEGRTHWELPVRGTDPDTTVGTLRLRDQAVSVSSVYGSRPRGARAVGHIVDPRTGEALRHEAVAVVTARSATDAEAFTKALLVWGRGGLARLERLGAGAVYVEPQGPTTGARAARERTFVGLATPEPIPDRAELPR